MSSGLQKLFPVLRDPGIILTKIITHRNRMKFLDKLSYRPLIFFTILLGLVPFVPVPHLFEKLDMLRNGTLSKPIDILDLLFHCAPQVLLSMKMYRDRSKSDN